MNRTKTLFIEITGYLFIFLFLYTAYAKLAEHSRFEYVLTKSPAIGQTFASMISWSIPIVELILALLLIIPRTKIFALYCSLVTMFIFTAYLIYMVFSGSTLPCNCGGVVSELTWQEHIIFNFTFIALAVIALWFHRTRHNHNPTNLQSSNKLQFHKS